MQARSLATAQVFLGFGFSANAWMSLLGGGSAASLGEEGVLKDCVPHTTKARAQYLQALPMLIPLQFRLDI